MSDEPPKTGVLAPEDPGEPVAAADTVHPVARPFLFLDSPRLRRNMVWILAALVVVLVLLEAAAHRHAIFSMEGTVAFYAVFGFAAFAFVVLAGWPLRRLLSRPEDYYGSGDDDG